MNGRRHSEISDRLHRGGGVILAAAHPELRRTLEREVHRGTLVTALPGTFVAAGCASDPEVLARAVCTKYRTAVIAGFVAAGLTFWPSAARLPVEGRNLRVRTHVPWLRTSRAMVPRELVVSVRGMRLASPELTALDLAVESHGESIFALLRNGSGTVSGLGAALAAMSGLRGNPARARALGRAANNPWSGGEEQFQILLRHQQLSEFVGNLRVRVFGREYVVDLALERLRIGIEFDSVRHHTDRKAFEHDRRKHNDLEAAGWRILHVTWQMIMYQPEEVLRRILQLIRGVEQQ